jgi:hypothetical protein
MAGLGTAAPAAPAQQQGMAPQERGESAAGMLGQFDESALEQASPEEQAQYEQFVNGMMAVVYPEQSPGEVNPAILANLKGQFEPDALQIFEQAEPALTDSPQDSLAATAVILTMMGESQAEYTDDVVMHGGAATVEELIEVAEAAKIHDFSEEDIETVTYRAMDLYRIASPRADPAALSEQFQMLMAANEQGNLGSVLPGLPGGAPMQQQQQGRV